MIDRPGVYEIPLAEYLADPCPTPSLNHSVAVTLQQRSPLHAMLQHPRLTPSYVPPASPAFDLGSVVHDLYFGGVDRIVVVDADDWKKASARVARETARAQRKIPLLRAQFEQASDVVEALAFQGLAWDEPRPFMDGRAEQTFIWQERDIWCRTRPDYYRTRGPLVLFEDLKTTGESAHPAEWGRRLFERGLGLQVGFARRAARKLGLGLETEFRFVVIEVTPPYGMSVVALDPEAEAFCDAQTEHAITLWGQCVRESHWPSYRRQTSYLEVPPWVRSRWDERAYYEEGPR